MNNDVYNVLVSERGMPTVMPQSSPDYPTFIQSGNYTVMETGSKKDCDKYAKECIRDVYEG